MGLMKCLNFCHYGFRQISSPFFGGKYAVRVWHYGGGVVVVVVGGVVVVVVVVLVVVDVVVVVGQVETAAAPLV